MRSDRRVRTSWRQTTIYNVVEARPINHTADWTGRGITYRVRLASGTTLELPGDTVCERLSNEHGERIVLTIDRAAHVLAAHMRGKRGGVFQPGMTLTRVLGLFCRQWHQPLGSGERSRKIRVRCDRVVGTSGVASARELAELAVLSETDLRRLAQLKEEVFAANLYGSARDRAALIARVNKRWRGGSVRLTERDGVILPAFIVPPQPTRSFVVALGRSDDRRPAAPDDDEWRIHTIYPGKLLCDPPAHVAKVALPGQSDPRDLTTIGELQRQLDSGQALSERERVRLRAFRDAFEVWYQHGPLLPAAIRRSHSPRHQRASSGGTALRRP